MNIIEQFPGENEIVIAPETLAKFGGHVQVNGRGNRIILEHPVVCINLFLEVNGDSIIEIGKDCIFHDQHIRIFAPGKATVGSGCAWNGHSVIHMHESATVTVGGSCLIAGGVSFSSSHVHKILDMNTRERLNPGGDITVGERVWFSSDAKIWPGADIGHDSVVGMGAYVNKPFPPHCVLAGTPARVVREGVIWEA